MQVFRGLHHHGIAPACALTIGNFDGVHRGHQAMLALLTNEARHRGVPSCVMTFEPHPRDYFAARAGTPEARQGAWPRCATSWPSCSAAASTRRW
jgi:riboflavin kinase/FMN adenylyltransferase